VIDELCLAGVAATATAPGRIVVALERPVVYDVVRDVLADTGVGLRRLQKRRASLEEVYLEASNAARAR
jgi:hypothetical protein